MSLAASVRDGARPRATRRSSARTREGSSGSCGAKRGRYGVAGDLHDEGSVLRKRSERGRGRREFLAQHRERALDAEHRRIRELARDPVAAFALAGDGGWRGLVLDVVGNLERETEAAAERFEVREIGFGCAGEKAA